MSDAYALSSFAGKVAVVTGGAQGIGEATARLLAARGAAGIVLVDRRVEKGEAVAASLNAAGTKTIFVAADLADPAAVARVIPAADKAFGRVDLLANIAGLTDRGSIFDTDLALFDVMFAVNVRAPFFLIQDALKLMQRDRIEGAIVNILSVNAHVGARQPRRLQRQQGGAHQPHQERRQRRQLASASARTAFSWAGSIPPASTRR